MKISQTQLLAQAAITITKFIHRGKKRGVILSGNSSAKIALPLVKHTWDKFFPNFNFPPIYQFNKRGSCLLYKNLEPEEALKRTILVRAFIKDQFPGLMSLKNSPLCYLEDFLMLGEKYIDVRNMFTGIGFFHVTFVFLAGHEEKLLDPKDFVGVDNHQLIQYLFDLSRKLPEADKVIANTQLLIR